VLPAHVKDVTPTGFTTPVADALPAVVDHIVAVLQPERIILFGSYAYGAPTPDSDVDLLVILDTDASQKERHLMVARLLRPRPFPVDLLVKRPQEVDAALAAGDFFIAEIVHKGLVLYERGN